ncbi:PIG-L family deacetylase [Nonomuraea sp. NBC_01738]|uniref:PIG-L family deacetylase n=1 Tax=Nonomuraea sp. NBC_01738 TaxID=2976003 RepID=UPI002E14E385|nr:PIG-L family deacetylase [Nonomuraea sp. NBC_01738]
MKGIRAVAALACASALAVFTVCPVVPWTIKAVAAAPPDGERFVQVVAHTDDDLLFMSPDLYGAVVGGRPSVTIYLTAGEGPSGLEDHYDPVAYVRERQEGVRAAYAYLAGVRDVWRSRTLVAGTVPVRVDTLRDRPAIELVFAGLPDGGDPRADGGHDALRRMWDGTACVHRFAGPSPNPCVSRQDVITMIRALLARYRPTVLRTLDPAPPNPADDHTDHVASARFAAAAAPGSHARVVSYRGYTMTRWPSNLTLRARLLKRAVFEVYRHHDYRARSGGWRYRAWLRRMYMITRHEPGT